jgi:DNA (cytosine-5)-methyltransferase 1
VFQGPIRDLLTMDLPDDLFGIDILDGSPPCSTFSTAGRRERDWGREKRFREGQTTQVLSDLFFDYLDLVERLRPRVAIAENVKGLVTGNAKGYVRLIMRRFREIGYRPQLFLINALDCGVPQARERVFFCAIRDDLEAPPLVLAPRHRVITAAEALRDLADLTPEERKETELAPLARKWLPFTAPGMRFADARAARGGKSSYYSWRRLRADRPSFTLVSGCGRMLFHWEEKRALTFREWKRLGGFPDDYVAKSDPIGKYLVGVSVPPPMTEAVARAVIDQWLRPLG